MPIVNNRVYTDPNIGAAFSSIASMFAPPSGSDLAGYASAKDSSAAAALKKQKLSQLAQFFTMAQDPNANHTVMDNTAYVMGTGTPSQGYYGVDQNNATSRANNANTVQGSVIGNLFGPLSQGQVRPEVPANVAGTVGLPGITAAAGAPKPLSETEAKGQLIQQAPPMTPDQLTAIAMSDAKTANVIGPDGKPVVDYNFQSVGQQPAYAPNATIMSDGLPKPPDGTVWQLGPDGKPVLDDRGAPIAIPFQGGKVWDSQQKAESAAGVKSVETDNVNNIVDQTIAKIEADPWTTTGVGAQLTQGVWGSHAADVAALITTLKANAAFDQLQKLRDASPTGGALGQVSNQEESMLSATIANVEQSQSGPQLIEALNRYKQVRYDIINGPGAYEASLQAAPNGAGGAPAVGVPPGWDPEDWKYLTPEEQAQVTNGG